jgi:hypothetical protein
MLVKPLCMSFDGRESRDVNCRDVAREDGRSCDDVTDIDKGRMEAELGNVAKRLALMGRKSKTSVFVMLRGRRDSLAAGEDLRRVGCICCE